MAKASATNPSGSGNAKHAFTFFLLSLVVLVLPVLLPSQHKPAPHKTPLQLAQAASPVEAATPQAPTASPEASGSPQATSGSPTPHPAPAPPTTPSPRPQAPTPHSPSPTRTPEAVVSATATPVAVNTPDVDALWDDSNQGPTFEFKDKLQSVVVSLLLIVALIFVTLKIAQKYVPGLGKPKFTEQPLMNVLAQQTVAPGVHLSLVQVCNKNVLIGFTEHSVSVLCEIAGEELEKVRDANLQASENPEVLPVKTPKEVYGEILQRYLSIFPGFGAKR